VLPQNWRDELRKTIAKSALALTASAQSRKKATAPLIFRLLPRAGGVAVAPQTLAVNPLAALVDWSSRHRRAQRQEILAAALARIEAGETCYARIDPEGDAYAVWLGSGDELFAMSNRPAEKCMVLRGFGGLELDVRSPVGRDLLRDVVLKLRASGVTTPIYLTLARVDRIVRTFVEELGFREVTISGDADAA
jgi:hypothetical protein